MEKWIIAAVTIITLSTFLGMGMEQHNRHECRMEALKALQDPKMINEICGE